MEQIDTVIVGAGQAGLATSYHLQQHGREHVLLEAHRVAERWRSDRWDSFTLVTPNWTVKLPGFPLEADPDGYLTRDEIVAHLEAYAEHIDAPVRTGVRVDSVEPKDGSYLVRTSDGDIEARRVVIAVGTWQKPKVPAVAHELSPRVMQIHASEYRNSEALPAGAVLVAGSGQSGCQIAEDLRRDGRDVVVAVGSAPKMPRRFRGRDTFWWLDTIGFLDQTPADLESPADRFKPNPIATGRDGGHELGLHELARDGVRLVGRVKGCDDTRVRFATNLDEVLATYDAAFAEIRGNLAKAADGVGIPPEDGEGAASLRDAHDAEPVAELDLEDEGIGAIVWATGFGFDFSWIDLPILDDFGYPVTDRGVTEFDGLYFVGLNWQHNRKSPLFYGVGDDAKYVVEAIEASASA